MSSSGLDALRNRGRGERKRPIPPPKHSPRATPVELEETAEGEAAAEAAVETPAPVESAEASVPVEAAQTAVVQDAKPVETSPATAPEPAVSSPDPAQQTTVVTAEPMTKKTIFVGATEDAFMRQVVVSGMMHRGGKVDSNQSATIRLALRRLQAELTPDQVVEEIKQGLTKTGESGRPRF